MSEHKKNLFTAKNIALAAMFAAVSFGLSFIEFPLFAATPYLKLDFSFSAQLLGAFILGPVLGEFIVVSVQMLRLLISSSGGVGELANLVAATCFVFVPSLIYKFKKGLPTVFVSLFLGSVLEICASLASNRFLVFPLYMGAGARSVFEAAFAYLIAFNAIKCFGNALITFLLYKRLKRLFFRSGSKPVKKDERPLPPARSFFVVASEDYALDFGGKLKKTSKFKKVPDNKTGYELFD